MKTLNENYLNTEELSFNDLIDINGGSGESAWYWIAYGLSRGFHPTPATWTNPTAGELMSA